MTPQNIGSPVAKGLGIATRLIVLYRPHAADTAIAEILAARGCTVSANRE